MQLNFLNNGLIIFKCSRVLNVRIFGLYGVIVNGILYTTKKTCDEVPMGSWIL